MSQFIERLLMDVFAAEGDIDAERKAKAAVEVLRRVQALDEQRLAVLDRAAKVYELRAKLPEGIVAIRIDKSPRTVRRDNKLMMLIRRGA